MKHFLSSSLVRKTSFLMCLSLSLTACKQSEKPDASVGEKEDTQQNVQVVDTLAMVNNLPVTQSHIDVFMTKKFTQADQLLANVDVQKKVLDSLVASTALAEMARAGLSQNDLERIAIEKRLYEEELLLRTWLQQHSTPEPVTETMVLNHYNNNLALYGQENRYDITWLKINDAIEAQDLAAVLNAKANTWESLQDNPHVEVVKQKLLLSTLPPELASTLEKTAENSVSQAVTDRGITHRFFVKSIDVNPAKPIAEVSTEIRKKLAGTQLKKHLKVLREQALSKASIEYIEQ